MTNAEKFFFAGGAHARAAHALLAASQANVHMAVPFYLLVGFALETVLKAAYVQLGGDMKSAKYEIGHDLPRALPAHAVDATMTSPLDRPIWKTANPEREASISNVWDWANSGRAVFEWDN